MNGLKVIMSAKGLEYQDVADYLGVTTQSVSNWVLGKRKMTDKRALELSKWFGVNKLLIIKESVTEEEKAEIHYQLGFATVFKPKISAVDNEFESETEFEVALEDDYKVPEQLVLDLQSDADLEGPENFGTLDDLSKEIAKGRKEVRVDEFDITISELLSMYRDRKVIDVHPEFQRMYRWSAKQKSRLIESILLGIPIPPIFVAEDSNAEWDIVDGVQRLSTFFQFFGALYDDQNNWVPPYFLEGTERLKSLQGKVWSNEIKGCESRFAFEHNSEIKNKFLYSKIRIVRINNESTEDIKYDLFDRLNSGGTMLQPQELRNSLAIMINRDFYTWLRNLSVNRNFIETIPLGEQKQHDQTDMDYALRFFVYRHVKRNVDYEANDDIKDMITDGLKKFCKDKSFNYAGEKEIFDKTFELINKALGDKAFKKYFQKDKKFKGKVMLTSYELIAIGVANNLNFILGLAKPEDYLREKIKNLYTQDFYLEAQKNKIFNGRAIARFEKLTSLGTEYFSY
ncbi:GmrSD restriction endonuclease domain-containing protein [Lysinibacillus xylanilyticus]|uniref:GmrSD restriction endonuclease domain-containing protein n=1 Tax=Lysinibacillus xylanilyticus TaxID=582475 RepID=UPI003D01FF48